VVRGKIAKGHFVKGMQHPRIFGRGHTGRGRTNIAPYKGLFYCVTMEPVLQLDISGPQESVLVWTCLPPQEAWAASGHVWTTWVCASPGRVYTTGGLSFTCTYLDNRSLCLSLIHASILQGTELHRTYLVSTTGACNAPGQSTLQGLSNT